MDSSELKSQVDAFVRARYEPILRQLASGDATDDCPTEREVEAMIKRDVKGCVRELRASGKIKSAVSISADEFEQASIAASKKQLVQARNELRIALEETSPGRLTPFSRSAMTLAEESLARMLVLPETDDLTSEAMDDIARQIDELTEAFERS